jgi:uncharacterized protein (DUF488 family)
MEFFTIGVFNSKEQTFFDKLIEHRIDTFCDIRQRRGVRGSEYSFVNSNKLQQKLIELNINYMHILDLAPTTEIREMQKVADKSQGINKRVRNELGAVFKLAYTEKVLKCFDFESFISELKSIDSKRIVLFCVEEKHEACHRSIVANKLRTMGFQITNI